MALVPKGESSLEKKPPVLPRRQPSPSTSSEPKRPVGNLPPRHPSSLQGLVRFSIEIAKDDENLPKSELGPIDEDRKKFLQDALSALTIDVVQVLQQQIKILREINHMTEDEVPKYVDALSNITEYVDSIDVANDFYKIGGFVILLPCMRSPYANIRAMACELVAILCQNNPYCQRVVLDNGFVPVLLNLINTDSDIQVVIKSIYALGSIVRENSEGLSQLLDHNGLTILLKGLKGNNDNVIIKTCFLLASICRISAEVKNQMVKLGYIHQLLTLFKMERCPSHEYVLSLLVIALEDCPAAAQECEKFPFNVRDLMHKHMVNARREEFFEEEEFCKRILLMINAER